MRYHCAHLEKIPQAHMQISSIDFTLFTGFAQVKAKPPLIFCVIQLLWWQFFSAAHHGGIRIAFSTPMTDVWWESGQTGAGA